MKSLKGIAANRSIGAVFLLIIIIILFSASVCALGVAPGGRTFVYSGQQIQYEIRIMNDESKDVTYLIEVNGELAEYLTLSKNSVTFSSMQADEVISASLYIPAGENVPPGDYVTRIIVKGDESSGGGVVAFAGVISKLTVTIPGDKAYVKSNLFVPNFIQGQQNQFSIEIANKGAETAEDCFAIIDVYSSLNAKVASLISSKVDVQGVRVEKLYVPWTPQVNNGNYLASASVICNGISSSDEKSFSIGSPEINVAGILADDFTLGEINKVELILENEWGETINDVYADIDVASNGDSVFRTTTASVDILPMQKEVVPVYLDTSDLAPGSYSLYIMLHYMDKDVGEAYDVRMSTDQIIIDKVTGMVTGNSEKYSPNTGGSSTNTILIISIIVIVGLNLLLVLKLRKKK